MLTLAWLEYFGFFGYPIFTGLLFIFLSCLALTADRIPSQRQLPYPPLDLGKFPFYFPFRT
ncbi:MAG: hypothetical protein ACUVR3_10950 [Candidatus Roseilinea sp.]|uniref:hypothetical protein n=1 Tax=Candidatus Roseilinea sp. TaxID=2838777 RepID=UPI00404AD83A